MCGELFDNGILRVVVPTDWKLFYGIDSECKVDPKKLHIYKNAQRELDIFHKAGVTVCLIDTCISTKWFYDNVKDIEPMVLGNYQWNGYTCTSLGYPYTMLETTGDGFAIKVMILMENNGHTISLDDEDVRMLLESIEVVK